MPKQDTALLTKANQSNFMLEFLCFTFKCTGNYYMLPACQHLVEPVEGFSYLNNVIESLYESCRDQGRKIIDVKYTRRENDHTQVIGYNN